MYQLRFRVNKFHYEILLNTESASLAYGMKKKLIQEQPQTYHKNKLIVKILKDEQRRKTKIVKLPSKTSNQYLLFPDEFNRIESNSNRKH